MKQKGFTLIELLVVISVIGLLASIVLVSLNAARGKARDSRRIADLRQMSTALAIYYDKNGRYPNDNVNGWDKTCAGTEDLTPLITQDIIGSIPCDPLNTGVDVAGSGYGYFWDSEGPGDCAYTMYANLESGGVHTVHSGNYPNC